MQASQYRGSDNLPVFVQALRVVGNLLVDTLMRTRSVVVADVFSDNPVQMTFSQQDEEIETLTPEAAPEALADRVGLWGPRGNQQNVNARPLYHPPKHLTKLTIPIPDEKTWFLIVWGGFPQLLGYPGVSWMASHCKVDDTT
jgi:hypothetical protein